MSVWKRRGTSAGSGVSARIEEELTALRPMLHIRQATITLVEYAADTGVAVLRFDGDCPDCEMTAAMLRQAVEAHLRTRIPELREVRALEG
jgi:Fe-S cluster biogenesis protein NfuA